MKITNQALTSQSSDPILLNSCIITDQVGLHTVLIRLHVYVLWPIGRPLSLASPTLPQRGAFYSVRPITFREMTAAPLSKSLLRPVVRRPISAYPGLSFNLGYFIPFFKGLFQIISSILFRTSRHQIVGKSKYTECALKAFRSEVRIHANPGLS